MNMHIYMGTLSRADQYKSDENTVGYLRFALKWAGNFGLVDQDTVYSPRQTNDRLLLGLNSPGSYSTSN